MAKMLNKKDGLIKKLKATANSDIDEETLMALATGTDAQKQQALKKILGSQRTLQEKLKHKQETAEKAKRAVAMLTQRDHHNRQLQKNWQKQLKQMEQAVLLCSQIHGRDRKKFAGQLAEKEEQIKKLKAYVQKMDDMRSKQNKGVNNSSN